MAKKIDKQKLKQQLAEHGLEFNKQGSVRINFDPRGNIGKIETTRIE